ncbi:hypothetical protein [Conexibacter arvalis]|uniref:Uncharacterized protein n=1 Tax=Conexibacter arvalis TaxID=912552 RepID=A0A840IFZ4_9ACTN|nr:hypothetical protein [Conexibacter arvalis]MBB4663161.1 hypothetical protein [Conexibacter arvalis]
MSVQSKVDDRATKARERAAARATPEIAKVLNDGQRIRLAALIEKVAKDAADTGLNEYDETVMKRLGNTVVKHGLLVGYTAAKYGDGAWLARSTSRTLARAFEAAKS